ncbi:MAG: DUF4271 domain-containing protein [Bacteroidia bacterium]|nr:DUF4271 domain-containing protein [Bacteroidia bacterium]
MTDSTQVTLPAAQAFLSGRLDMPVNIQASGGNTVMEWADYPSDYIPVMVAVILILATLKALMGLFPLLLDSASRWKGCITIDSSIRLKSDRNLLGLIWLLPYVLIADRYNLLTAGILDSVPPQWHVSATAGVIAAWFFLRFTGYLLCSLRVKRPETFRTAHKCIFNYVILLAALLSVAAGIFSITGISENGARTVVLYGSIAFYLLTVLREMQILGTFCGQFRTFLYLCALEILPTGALIAGNILL